MKQLVPSLLAILALAALPGHAQVVSLTRAQWYSGLHFDIDGDGNQDLYTQQQGSGLGLLGRAYIQGLTFPEVATYPTGNIRAAGFEAANFATLADAEASTFWDGSFTGPVDMHRASNSYYDLTPSSTLPVRALWLMGDASGATGDIRLMSILIDAQAYFESGGTANIDLYYHYYGSFGAGDSGFVSMDSSLGVVPEPASIGIMGLLGLGGFVLIRQRKA